MNIWGQQHVCVCCKFVGCQLQVQSSHEQWCQNELWALRKTWIVVLRWSGGDRGAQVALFQYPGAWHEPGEQQALRIGGDSASDQAAGHHKAVALRGLGQAQSPAHPVPWPAGLSFSASPSLLSVISASPSVISPQQAPLLSVLSASPSVICPQPASLLSVLAASQPLSVISNLSQPLCYQ